MAAPRRVPLAALLVLALCLRAAPARADAAAGSTIAGLLRVDWALNATDATFTVQALQPAGAAALALGTGMSGATAYVAWFDVAAGVGRVVSYYVEEGNSSAAGVMPTGEALRDASVNVSGAGVLAFRFTRALAGVPTRAPPRPLGPDALLAFPVAAVDEAAPAQLTAALFPSWTVADAAADSPAPGDAHYAHAGSPWTVSPPYVELSWATGAPTADGQVALDDAAAAALTLGGCGGSAFYSPLIPGAISSSSSSSTDGSVVAVNDAVSDDASLCACNNLTLSSLHVHDEHEEEAPSAPLAPPLAPPPAADSPSAVVHDMSAMGMSDASMGMHDAFFTRATGWGSVLFDGAVMGSEAAFVGAVLLSSLFAALTTLGAAAARPVERRGADASAHGAWLAAGVAATALRTGSHYVSMLLVMTFNVWIILAVLFGHAAGYLLLATAFRNGALPPALHAALGAGGSGGDDGSVGGLALGGASGAGAPLLQQGKQVPGCGVASGSACDCA